MPLALHTAAAAAVSLSVYTVPKGGVMNVSETAVTADGTYSFSRFVPEKAAAGTERSPSGRFRYFSAAIFTNGVLASIVVTPVPDRSRYSSFAAA